MSKYATKFKGYKIEFSGVAYVEADSEEEAKEKYEDGDYVYKEMDVDSVDPVTEMVMCL